MKYKQIAVVLLGAMITTSIPGQTMAAENVTGKVLASQVAVLAEASTIAEYRLSKYDVINIVIIGFSDGLNNSISSGQDGTKKSSSDGFNDIIIGPDGYVNLPYAGTVKLAGLTISEATTLLTNKLGEYIKIPGMAVMVKEYGPRKVYVMGEVAKPGIYSLTSDYMNVFAALSSAGGISKRGRPKHIGVVRVMDGKVRMQEINFDNFVEKQDASQNIALQDGDMVYVPKSDRIDLNDDILPIISTVGLLHSLSN